MCSHPQPGSLDLAPYPEAWVTRNAGNHAQHHSKQVNTNHWAPLSLLSTPSLPPSLFSLFLSALGAPKPNSFLVCLRRFNSLFLLNLLSNAVASVLASQAVPGEYFYTKPHLGVLLTH